MWVQINKGPKNYGSTNFRTKKKLLVQKNCLTKKVTFGQKFGIKTESQLVFHTEDQFLLFFVLSSVEYFSP